MQSLGTYTLTNCTILTVDEADTFFARGRMTVQNGRILRIGSEAELPLEGDVADMGGKLVLPGLVNTHTHSHSSLFKNQADDLRLMDWLNKAMWPMEAHLSAERARAATALSCMEYISGGITTYADQFYYAEAIAPVASASGLRCLLAATVFEKPSVETDDTFGAATAFVERWLGREEETRVYPCLGPHAPYSVGPELFGRVADFCRKHDVLLHTHISETQDENDQIRARYGKTPTQWLEGLGVLENRVLAAHSIHLDERDMRIYARRGVHASYNPVSNLKLVSGIMPYRTLREHGIQVSIGTDGAQSNNSMDLLRDLRTGALIQKQAEGDPTLFPAREMVRLCTIEGARALDLERQIGSLEAGKRADFIALDTESPRLCPLHRSSLSNLYSAVAYAACGADVSDMAVDGNWVMKDRTILTMDCDAVRKEAQEASEYLVRHSQVQ
ncbi:MAG: amidohydrolase [Clostridiales bacterium]|nr:amidohydrolase [Clostridiales bacterium]